MNKNMTRMEERIESFNWCVFDYLKKLREKVDEGKISACDISKSLFHIARLTDTITGFVRYEFDEKTTEDLFMKDQVDLNDLLKR